METEEVKELLDENISIVPWRYKILEGDEIIEFTNVEVKSVSEEKFLKGLEEEGDSKIIESSGRTSYLIKRENGKLWAHLAKEDGEIVDELGEITEKEALEIREPDDGNEGVLEGLVSVFKGRERDKEPVSNRIRLGYDSIEDIKLKKSEKRQNKGLIVIGEGFEINIRGDGGCQVSLS